MRNPVEIKPAKEEVAARDNAVRETVCRGNFTLLKGEKDDVHRAVRTLNAIECLKVMPLRYEKFLVVNQHQCM